MSKDIEIGTRYHTAYERAFRREQIKGRIAVAAWIVTVMLAVPFSDTLVKLAVGIPVSVLGFLGIAIHWSREAVRFRAHKRTDV